METTLQIVARLAKVCAGPYFALLESRPHIHSKYYKYDPLGIKRRNIDGAPLFWLHHPPAPPPGLLSIHSWAPGTEVNRPDMKEVLPRPNREEGGSPCPGLWLVAGAAGGRGLEEGRAWPTRRPQGARELSWDPAAFSAPVKAWTQVNCLLFSGVRLRDGPSLPLAAFLL